ncbi:pectinesterase family protein [Pedobacter sp. AW1-32]|uniref:pectinesterase family protein n=1 Tax=Pedobacter sp. AW1-32 TaxID=3383026 RepID=UPI003FF0CE5A
MKRNLHAFPLLVLLFFCFGSFAQVAPISYPSSFTVAQDGSGDFKTVQEAINAVRDLSQQQVSIFIKPGIYTEKLVIPSWKQHISLIGTDKEITIITNADYSGKSYLAGKDLYGNDKFSTYTSYTLLISGSDCTVENLTIRNTAGRVGQAVALHIEGDRTAVFNCSLLGNQDTLYAATESSRQYYKNCYIEGTTDFIFGQATAFFEDCTIKSLQNSYITAAATSRQQAYGFVFLHCTLIADAAATKVFLGRPWRPYAKTVFIRTNMDKHIRAEGWDNWRNAENEKTTFYAEAENTGIGADVSKRVTWAKQLNAKMLKKYKIENVLSGSDHWMPKATTTK